MTKLRDGTAFRGVEVLGSAVLCVLGGTSLFGPVPAAALTALYAVSLGARGVHRSPPVCAATTWVPGLGSLRAGSVMLLNPNESMRGDVLVGFLATIATLRGWWRNLLPFGFDWTEFPFVAFGLQVALLDAFPVPGRLRDVLREPWLQEWQAWEARALASDEAESLRDAHEVARDFVQRFQRLLAEIEAPVVWSDSEEGIAGPDLDLADEASSRDDSDALNWTHFPFVGVELRPARSAAFPDWAVLRRALRRTWVRERDAWGDAVAAIRDAPDAGASAEIATEFVQDLQRLLA